MKKALYFIVITTLILFSCKNNKEKELELRDLVEKFKTEEFYKLYDDYNMNFSNAITLNYIGVNGNDIVFEVTNNTRYPINKFSFEIYLYDAYKKQIDFKGTLLDFNAVDPTNQLMPNNKSYLNWDFQSLRSSLMKPPFSVDIGIYKNYMSANISVKSFSIYYDNHQEDFQKDLSNYEILQTHYNYYYGKKLVSRDYIENQLNNIRVDLSDKIDKIN